MNKELAALIADSLRTGLTVPYRLRESIGVMEQSYILATAAVSYVSGLESPLRKICNTYCFDLKAWALRGLDLLGILVSYEALGITTGKPPRSFDELLADAESIRTALLDGARSAMAKAHVADEVINTAKSPEQPSKGAKKVTPPAAALKKSLIAMSKAGSVLELVNPLSPTGGLHIPQPGSLFAGDKGQKKPSDASKKGDRLVGRVSGYDLTLNALIVDGRSAVRLPRRPDSADVGKKYTGKVRKTDEAITLRCYEQAADSRDEKAGEASGPSPEDDANKRAREN